MAQATRLARVGQLMPQLDPRHFTLETIDEAYALIRDRGTKGKLVVDL